MVRFPFQIPMPVWRWSILSSRELAGRYLMFRSTLPLKHWGSAVFKGLYFHIPSSYPSALLELACRMGPRPMQALQWAFWCLCSELPCLPFEGSTPREAPAFLGIAVGWLYSSLQDSKGNTLATRHQCWGRRHLPCLRKKSASWHIVLIWLQSWPSCQSTGSFQTELKMWLIW